MAGIVIGIILLAAGIVLLYFRKKKLQKVLNIKYQETTTASLIMDNLKHIAGSLGAGNYTEIVELSGLAVSDAPLIAEHSKNRCVYYKASIIREYETREQERDSNGNLRWVTKRHSETVSTNEQVAPFYLDDNSGHKIRIDLQGAEKITQKSVDRFEREIAQSYIDSQRGNDFGNQLLNFLGNLSSRESGSKTLGYRFIEEIIPLNARLYVYGEASDRSGEVAVVRPTDKQHNFIVSVKSEQELIRSYEGSAKWLLVGAIASFVIGAIALVVGFTKL